MYLKMECSIMLFFLFFAVPTILSEVFATSLHRDSLSLDNQNQSCTTSDNVSGICVLVFQCEKYFDVYKKGPTAPDKDKQLLRSAYCGSRPLDQRVCCEEAAVSKTTEKNTNKRCGESPFNRNALKIIGGKNSTLGAWPWMAALSYRNSSTGETAFVCSGSLIADNWVLTAAHCIPTSPDVELDHVRLGDLDLDENVDDGANPIEVKVENVIKHPNFTTNTSLSSNDIALLQLEESVTFTDYISPICLHKGEQYATNENIYDKKRPTIAGWGGSSSDNHTTMHMLEVSLDTVPLKKCKEFYPRIEKSVLCTKTPKKRVCQRDAGGPLMFVGKGSVWSQGGIASFGYKCCDSNHPSVFTKVAPFVDWIEKETGLIF